MADRVFIVTGLRLQALHMVNAQDFTYSKGYLGLLSAIGASLTVFFCCAPCVVGLYHLLRKAPMDEILDEPWLPMIEDSATKAHDRSARWSVDAGAANAEPPPYGGLRRNHTF